MQPRKDYDDYSRFINDTFVDEKVNMLSQTVSFGTKLGGSRMENPAKSLRTYSEFKERPIYTIRSGF